jgi:hypothetical protein
MIHAHSLAHLASEDNARRDNSVIRWAQYERTAREQLAAYARMTDDELARELKRFNRGKYRSAAHQTQSRFKETAL